MKAAEFIGLLLCCAVLVAVIGWLVWPELQQIAEARRHALQSALRRQELDNKHTAQAPSWAPRLERGRVPR